MKRHKRNQSKRAFYKGYLAATHNKAMESCPYESGELHQAWTNGWREGREDYWSGLDASTVAQKLETYRAVTANVHHPDGWSTM